MFLLTAFLLVATLSIMTSANKDKSNPPPMPPSEYRPSSIFLPENGCVPDKDTAQRIAEAVWLPIYGEDISQKKPFRAELIGDSIWAVAGSLPNDMIGGVPYIEIQKSDGKILGIGHSK
jgi:hypothetical protein